MELRLVEEGWQLLGDVKPNLIRWPGGNSVHIWSSANVSTPIDASHEIMLTSE